MIAHPGPVFYRCGYKKEPPIHQGPIHFEFGKAIQVRDGRDLTFIFTGTIGNQVLPAADALEKEGIHCRIISMHTVKPIDREAIIAAARETGGLVVVEEHQCIGGLGGAVAEVLANACVAPKRFLHIALPDVYVSKVGTHEWLLDQYGLSAQKITGSVHALLT
jgi:transketolase